MLIQGRIVHCLPPRSRAPQDSQVILSPYVAACRNWMSLDPDGDGCGENGREVVARLRGVLEEERLLKVSLSALYRNLLALY